ncbi:MAG TPA: hypothetical protein VF614_05010 [Chthoniobacteraceae bacterium]|jgi:hypothetical protein
MQWTDILAFWGALTGTIALSIQAWQHWADRADLRLIPRLIFTADETGQPRLDFTIEAVNHGRRAISIETAGIEFPDSFEGLPLGSSKAQNELIVFNSETDGGCRHLEGDGKKFTFGMRDFPREFLKELHPIARAFVRDTRGKRHRAKFEVFSDAQLQGAWPLSEEPKSE